MKEIRVGTGVMVIRNGRVLIGKRQGSHGAGNYAFPGGHQDFWESWEQCALREVEEETGLTVQFRVFDPVRKQPYAFVTDNRMEADGKHYWTAFLVCDSPDGEPVVKEPHKCDGWEWVTFAELVARMPPDAVAASKAGQYHEALHWFPIDLIEANLQQIGLERGQ